LGTDGFDWVQRGLSVLKHQGDLPASQVAHRVGVGPEQVDILVRYPAVGDFGVVRQEPHDRQRQSAFAGTALSHDAEDLAFTQREAHVIQGFHPSGGGAETNCQVFYA